MSAHETTSSGDLVAPEGRRQDVFAILTMTATVLLTLALVSYDARNGGANLVGPVGHRLAKALMLAFGLAKNLYFLSVTGPNWILMFVLLFFSLAGAGRIWGVDAKLQHRWPAWIS